MQQYEKVSDKTYTFSSCEICEAKCCDGLKNTVMNEITLDEFQTLYTNFPILFILGDKGFLKPVILLSNAKGFCKYLKDFKCSIYDKRPMVCRTYPLSATVLNEIYIDKSCPAVNQNGNYIIKDGKINQSFDHEILNNYQEKYLETYYYFEKLNLKENLEDTITINGIKFFKFVNNFDKKYVELHKKSLKNLDSYFF
jgi:Fe-S-cluster containining protein